MPKAAAEPRKAPERLLDLGEGLGLWRVHVDDLHEQALNAQVMPSDMFARLSATIGRDNRLESLPFCAMTDLADADEPYIEIVSGHHRVRSARAAGLFYVHCLVDETGLTPDQIRAKQLAHNSIAGSSGGSAGRPHLRSDRRRRRPAGSVHQQPGRRHSPAAGPVAEDGPGPRLPVGDARVPAAPG